VLAGERAECNTRCEALAAVLPAHGGSRFPKLVTLIVSMGVLRHLNAILPGWTSWRRSGFKSADSQLHPPLHSDNRWEWSIFRHPEIPATSKLLKEMERETGLEPATSSLGSSTAL